MSGLAPTLPASRAITSRRSWMGVVMLLIMSAVIILERFHTMDEPLDRDIAGYAVLSHEMLAGRKLYSDLWERKPPLVFAVFAAAECITGYGQGEVFLVNVVAALGTLVFIYLAGGIFAAGLWTLLSGDMWVVGNQPNAEVLVNLFVAGGFAMLLRESAAPRRWRAVGVGVMFAAATLVKHHVIVMCLALLFTGMLRKNRTDECRRRSDVVDVMIAVAVIVGGWSLLFGYFIAMGRFQDFFSALFRQNAAYAGSLGGNLIKSLQWDHLFPPAMRWTLVPLAVVLLWIAAGARNLVWNSWLMVVSYIISAWIVIALPGYFWGHYYQLLLPPLCIAGGLAAASLCGGNQRWPAIVRYGLLAIIFSMAACWQAPAYRLSSEQWAREAYTIDDLPEQKALGLQLEHVLLPNERFWELGEENEIYFAARRSPPSGLLYLEPLEFGPERNSYAARLLADLVRTKPDLIVIDHRWIKAIPSDSAIIPWIHSEYIPDRGRLNENTYQMFFRKGSDLARRFSYK